MLRQIEEGAQKEGLSFQRIGLKSLWSSRGGG